METATELRKAQLVMLRLLKIIDKICYENNIQYFLISGSLLGAVRHNGFIPWDDDLDIAMMREDYNKFLEVCKTQLPEGCFLQTRKTDKYYKVYHVPCKLRDTSSLLIEEGQENSKAHQGIYIDVFPFDKHSLDMHLVERDLKLWRKFMFLQRYTKKQGRNVFHKTLLFGVKKLAVVGLYLYFARANKRIQYNEEHFIDDYMISPGFDLYWSLTNIFKKSDIFPLVKLKFEDEDFFVPRNYHKVLTMIYGDYMKLPPPEKRTAHAITLIANIENK